jgi:two-component system, NtrC family, nitrogen regulation response regulator NtrX
MSRAHILIVDDEPDIRGVVKEILEDEGYQVVAAENAAGARASRRAHRPDLILLDIWMPDADGISLLREWSEAGELDAPVVMMSGHGNVETAVEATRLGAYDFIEKPISIAKLLLTIERALEASRLRAENSGLKQKFQASVEPLGSSRGMQELRALAERVASSDASVLLDGEPGTGKEQVARFIHAKSARREAPFIELSAASLAKGNALLELLGSEEGGQLRYGLIERANGGTLFIDEIADLDLELQGRLAAVFARKALTRLGAAAAVNIDVRVMASTSKDLDSEVRAGRFREELYYLLRVVPIKVVPLRERLEDVPELVHHFANLLANRDRLNYRKFSIAAQNRLRQHPWPGNIRELANLVQRLLIIGTAPEVDLVEVESALGGAGARTTDKTTDVAIDLGLPLREAREQFEREYLSHQLRLAGGSVGKLAKSVGMERTHLYRKLRSLGVDARDGENSS